MKKKGEKNVKLAVQIGKTASIVMVAVFIVLISATVMISSSAITEAIDDALSANAKSTALQIQNIVDKVESAAGNIDSYLKKAYRLSGEGARNMSGEAAVGQDGRIYTSMIFHTEISELSSDVEKFILETARNVVINNDDVEGLGVMFEPNKFDALIDDYSFYIKEGMGPDDPVTPYSRYEDYSAELFYKKAKEAKVPIFTTPVEFEGKMLISYAIPIIYEGMVKGVIVADINVDDFNKTVTLYEKYPNMYTTIYDQDYIDIYDSAAPEDVGHVMDDFYKDADELQATKEEMKKNEAFMINTTRESGGKIVRYFYPIEAGSSTWWAMTALSRSEKNRSNVYTVVVMIIVSILSLLIIMGVLITLLKRKIKPINKIVDAARHISEGNLSVEIEVDSNDEIGAVAQAFRDTISSLNRIIGDVNYLLGEMASGNFNVKTKAEESYVGDFRNILYSMRKLNDTLSDTLRQIIQASGQVSSGAGQMADSAQSLAEGATEQAGAVEELQATIMDVTGQVENLASDNKASFKVARDVEDTVKISSGEMDHLTAAMQSISDTSAQIGNIIGEIEDIASQTNLLSLNAAIEAARAGEAGKGFAVVAEQIRKLASDSAQSAVNTRNLIETTLHQIEQGNQITETTAKSLEQVIEGISKLAESAQESSALAEAQAESMRQLTQGVEQISNVVQNNSAVAEETSATSEELSAQAVTLNDLVGKFQLKKQ